MFRILSLTLVFMLCSCQGITSKTAPVRSIASVATSDLEEKLMALHVYSVLSFKYALQFEQNKRDAYFSLLAAREQKEKLESELLVHEKNPLLKVSVLDFAVKSKIHQNSMSGLISKLNLTLKRSEGPDKAMFESEYRNLEKSNEFQIFKTNIEHISHLMKLNSHQNKKVVKARMLDAPVKM